MGWSGVPWSFTVTCYELLKHKQHHQALFIQTTKVGRVICARTTAATHLSFCQHSTSNILFSTLPRELLYCSSLTRYRFFLELQVLLSRKWVNFNQILLRHKNLRYFHSPQDNWKSITLYTTINICSVPPAGSIENLEKRFDASLHNRRSCSTDCTMNSQNGYKNTGGWSG